MKFAELAKQEQVNAVKDEFIKIITALAEDKTAIKNYVPMPEALVVVNDKMSDEEKAAAVKHNEENAKRAETLKSIESILSKTERTEGCICGMCVKISFQNNIIPSELEPFIEAAQQNAQKENY